LFIEEESASSEQVIEKENGFKDSQRMLPAEQEAVFYSSVPEQVEEKGTLNRDVSVQISTASSFTEEQQYNRTLVNEQRKTKSAERRRYLKERREWRIALNTARQEAIDSGDYNEYELLKVKEPTKRVSSGDYAEYEALELEEPIPKR